MPRPVERIATPSPAAFWEEYVRPSRPVIFTDLFAAQPIRALTTAAKAQAALGGMPVQSKQEYTSVAFDILSRAILGDAEPPQARPPLFRDSTLGDYLALVAAEPATPLICSENPLGGEARALCELPMPLFRRPGAEARDEEVSSFMFLGNAGNVSSMHFDGDIAQLLHFQVFGRKRHILAEPRVAKKLLPIDTFSTVLLADFSERDKSSFVDYLDGWDCVLEPGEALFMPAQFWHHVEYVETAFSFNMRFGRNAYTRFVHRQMHRDLYRQNVAAKLLDPLAVETEYREHWRALVAACAAPYASPREKYRAMKALLKQLYAELCPEAIQADYSATALHEAIEEKLVVDLAKVYQPSYAGRTV
jgi:hypothetical protein